MKKEKLTIGTIPAILWGEPSDRVWLYVHGKMSSKEAAAGFAQIAQEKGYQTLSFDLPQHGDRAGETDRCGIQNGIRDLTAAADDAFARWPEVSLYACSLGACFSLHAFADRPFRRCLFQSPIADMEYLIQQMMLWFGITPERLEREHEIVTPVDLMTWEDFCYYRTHPVAHWPIPTAILYGALDNLQSRTVIQRFAQTHGCTLTVSETSEHPFMAPEDGSIVESWLRSSI